MRVQTDEWWLDELVTSASVSRAGTQSAFYRAVRAGQFATLCRGVHLPTHVWAQLGTDERFRARVHAAALSCGGRHVFSHLSAAALWRLPMVGSWPDKPEVVREPAAGGKSRAAFRAHGAGVPEAVVVIDRVPVTGLARTVVDVARSARLGTAVTMADAAMAGRPSGTGPLPAIGVTREELLSELDAQPGRAGRSRCAIAIGLADAASGSPGESVSRVGMYLQGLPAPVLQQEFRDRRGLIGYVDFWWPDFSVIGEFDGLGKYRREDMLRGVSPADAVIAEKVREDRLRALGPRVVRWGWETAVSPSRLADVLHGAGIR
jgi:hypothetical protein